MENLAIYASPLPFGIHNKTFHAIPGSTIQEIVDLVYPKGLSNAVGAVVQIGGHTIPRNNWRHIRPKIGANVVVNIVPQGGGGSKNPIASLLSIAVLIAAPYVAGFATAYAAGLGVTSLTGSMLVSGITRVAFSVVGSLLVNALAPPPKPSNPGGMVNNPAESPTQFIEGASNTIDPYGVVPIILGTNRYFPKQAARPYTETQDNDQYVRQLMTYGYGKIQISDIQIGETAISEFTDIEMDHKLNADLASGTSLFTQDVFQDDFNVLLEETGGFVTRTTQLAADEVIVDVTFPQGLAQFNEQGSRNSFNVQLELQYAQTGVSPQVWSPAATGWKAFSGATLTPAQVSLGGYDLIVYESGVQKYIGYRKDLIAVDNYTGVISLVQGPGAYSSPAAAQLPTLPANAIRLGTVTVRSTRTVDNTAPFPVTTIVSLTDDRNPALYGDVIEDSGDFIPSIAGSNVSVTGGSLQANQLDYTESQTEALRRSVRIKFPTAGQYDIRIRRISADTASDQIFDKAYLTAVRSVSYRNPVNLENISGTAVRMKATNQLNGTLDQFNVIASSIVPDYDIGTDTWIERPTSNPASLYRYVLQGVGNARALPDDEVGIAFLEEWHTYCVTRGYTYNRVIDYETSVNDILQDIAAAGSAAPDIVDGKRTVVIDREKDDIVQVVTPRNSSQFTGEIVYTSLPHAFRVQFRNKAKGYQQDERIVYADGYDENNATKFETLEYQSCTDSDLAFKHGRRHYANALLQPETFTFVMDVENLVATRGDRIKIAHDVPIIGIGDARIKEVFIDGNSPASVIGISLDDTITVPDNSTYYVRIRLSTGETLYKQLITSPGDATSFDFLEPFSIDDAPEAGDLCYIVEAGGELDLIITRIDMMGDLAAKISAVAYAPARFNAELITIPPFESNITTPLSFVRPVQPVLISMQSDEAVMLKNSDGSYTPRLIITLRDDNEGYIEPVISIRPSGTDTFGNANVLEATDTRIILTGMDDGRNYDIAIRYRRRGSTQLSLPLLINGYKFVGASSVPSDVQGFEVSITGDAMNFKWLPNPDIDIDFYRVKFSKVFTGGAWETAQILEDNIEGTRLNTIFQTGTYLIKAVDILGNESANATLITTYEDGAIRNVVAVLQESPAWAGVMDNVVLQGGNLVLADTSAPGYYYFANELDLGDVFTSFMSAAVIANGAFVNNIFEEDDIFALPDVFGQLGGDLFPVPDIFAMADVFGIGSGAWEVELQYRVTNDDPGSSPVNWSAWLTFAAGNVEFRDIQYRLKLVSLQPAVTPEVTFLAVTIDMPDRIEADNAISVPITGLRVNFDPAFKQLDGLAIVAQNLQSGDRAVVTNEDETGFDIIFYNSVGGPVVRIFSYVASGFGRVQS